MIISLPKSGYAVHFKDYMSQKAYQAYLSALSRGINPREVMTGEKDEKGNQKTQVLNDKIDYAAVDSAVLAALPYCVDQIVNKEGRTLKYNDSFIGDMPRSDFTLLSLEITRLKEEEEKSKEEGKKNTGESEDGSASQGSESPQ